MSDINQLSEFPNLKFILQWGKDSSQGLCCGIFLCHGTVVIRCNICHGGYCNTHKDWHKHTENNNGIIIK